MPSLRESQLAFASALAGTPAGAELPAPERIAIYRNSIREGFAAALRLAYPVTLRLVGGAFFDQACRHYQRLYPSLCGDLREYGSEFPDFLDGLPATRDLPWLGDVARLERALLEAAEAASPAPFDRQALAAIPAERFADLRLTLAPGARLVESRWPVVAIWRANHDPLTPAGHVDLALGAQAALVIRRGEDVEIERPGAAVWSLLRAFAADATCAQAAAAACAIDPGLDLAAVLGDHVARGTITGFRL